MQSRCPCAYTGVPVHESLSSFWFLLLLTHTLECSRNGTGAEVPTMQLGDSDGVPSSWLWPCLALTAVVICGNKPINRRSLSLSLYVCVSPSLSFSAFQIGQSIFVNPSALIPNIVWKIKILGNQIWRDSPVDSQNKSFIIFSFAFVFKITFEKFTNYHSFEWIKTVVLIS